MKSVQQPSRIGLWIVLTAGALAWLPATFPGYWLTLDGVVPLLNIDSAPLANVATAPDLWRGTGSAALLPARTLSLLGANAALAVRITFIVYSVLGALGIYLWLYARLGDRPAAVAALLYGFAPSTLATVYAHGSIGEATVLGLLPLALAGTSEQARTRSPAALAMAAIALLWMWRAQAGLALLATLLLVAYALLVERSVRVALVALASGLAGGLSLLPLWSTRAAPAASFADGALNLSSLFASGWRADGAFGPGVAALGLAIVVVWLFAGASSARQAARQLDAARLLAASTAGGALLLVLGTSVALPLWQATGASTLLSAPRQIALLATPLLAALGGLLVALRPMLQRDALWVALIAFVALSSTPDLTPRFTQQLPQTGSVSVLGDNQIVMLDADLTTIALASNGSGEVQLNVAWQVLRPLDFDYNVFFQAIDEEADNSIILAQIDTQPLEGLRPATTWQTGEILTDTYNLTWEGATEPDRFDFGLYNWQTGERLTTARGGLIDDKMVFHGP